MLLQRGTIFAFQPDPVILKMRIIPSYHLPAAAAKQLLSCFMPHALIRCSFSAYFRLPDFIFKYAASCTFLGDMVT